MFLAGTTPEIITETCLVALTTISYILPRRGDLVPVFEEILAQNIDTLLGVSMSGTTSVLLRSRMSLLLGYYADMLFNKFPEAFFKVIDFLVQSVGLLGEQKVVALQSADTLNTIISDKDLIPRLEPHLPRLIASLIESNRKVHIKLYFSFLQDFVKFYNQAIGDDIIPIVQSLVQRILTELKLCHEKGEKNNIFINKCWNVLRLITELDTFMPHYAAVIEHEMKPLFEFMVNPQQIEFEDDIVLSLKSFIKKTGQVSPVLWTLFPHLYKVFNKNKKVFGNLLDTINQYMMTGRQEMALNRDFLAMIVNMAKDSLFCVEPTVTINNAEGAILL